MEWFIEETEFERKEPDHEEPIVIGQGIDQLKSRGKEEIEDTGEYSYLYKVVKDTDLFRIEMVWRVIPEESDLSEEEVEERFGRILGSQGSYVANSYIKQMGFNPMSGILQDPEFVDDEPPEEVNPDNESKD